MMKTFAALVLLVSGLTVTAAYAVAHVAGPAAGDRQHLAAPEIDPSSAVTALTLLLGGVTVIRSRIGKK